MARSELCNAGYGCRRIISLKIDADIRLDFGEASRRNTSGVEGVEQYSGSTLCVLTVQLRIAVLMTNQSAESDASEFERTKVIPGRIVGEIVAGQRFITRAKALVVSIDKLALTVDDIKAVVWFMRWRKVVCGTEHGPYVLVCSYLCYPLRGFSKARPVVIVMICRQIMPGIT